MKPEDHYHRFVQWSDEDNVYIGYCPDLYSGGICHSEKEEDTYSELCTIIRDEIAHRLTKNETLPRATVKATRELDYSLA